MVDEIIQLTFKTGIKTDIQLIGDIFGHRKNNSEYELAISDDLLVNLYKTDTTGSKIIDITNKECINWLNKQLQDYASFLKSVADKNNISYTVLLSLPDMIDEKLPNYIQEVNTLYPSWDTNKIECIGLEDKEWVIDSDKQESTTFQYGKQILHYPYEKQQYYSSRITTTSTAVNDEWDLIYKASDKAKSLGFDGVFINGEDIREYGFIISTKSQPDCTGLRQIKIYNNNVEKYELTLLKNSGKRIMTLGNSNIESIDVGLNKVYELKFTVPFYYTDDITLQVVKNEEYDVVKEKQIVQVNGKDKFVIENISNSETEGGNELSGATTSGVSSPTKVVTAYSIENNLNKRKIELPQMTAQLHSDSVNTSTGFLDLVEKGCS